MSERRILVVDDEKNIRLTLSQSLDTLNLVTDTAADGEDALEKLGGQVYDLVLLDLRMPGMDGMEVLRRARELRPELPVVILTAYGSVESAVEAMKLGAVDFLQKPFSPREIRELVTQVLERRKLDPEQAEDYATHIQLAKRAIGERSFGRAAEHVRKAIALEATHAEAFNLLGALQEIGGERLGAQKSYRIALTLDPTYPPAVENLKRTAGASTGRMVLEPGDQEER